MAFRTCESAAGNGRRTRQPAYSSGTSIQQDPRKPGLAHGVGHRVRANEDACHQQAGDNSSDRRKTCEHCNDDPGVAEPKGDSVWSIAFPWSAVRCFGGFFIVMLTLRRDLNALQSRIGTFKVTKSINETVSVFAAAIRSAVLAKVSGERHETNPSAFLGQFPVSAKEPALAINDQPSFPQNSKPERPL